MFLFRSFNPLQVSYKLGQEYLRQLLREGFQSLIGQLQTLICLTGETQRLLCFNPLQVSYKLGQEYLRQLLREGFQSLIGQLQTKYFTQQSIFPNIVSIPYRLATNCRASWKVSTGCNSFNPLQVSYKPFVTSRDLPEEERFQSLIGQLQTIGRGLKLQTGQSVSIPYRLATNGILA